MSAKDHITSANTVPTESLGAKFKSKVVGLLTGPVFVRVYGALVVAVSGWIMLGWAGAVEKLPWIEDVVDPAWVVAIAAGLLWTWLPVLVARITGRPVRELQEKLREAGLYTGRIDGLKGPKTDRALEGAINDDRITVRRGRLVKQGD